MNEHLLTMASCSCATKILVEEPSYKLLAGAVPAFAFFKSNIEINDFSFGA